MVYAERRFFPNFKNEPTKGGAGRWRSLLERRATRWRIRPSFVFVGDFLEDWRVGNSGLAGWLVAGRRIGQQADGRIARGEAAGWVGADKVMRGKGGKGKLRGQWLNLLQPSDFSFENRGMELLTVSKFTDFT